MKAYPKCREAASFNQAVVATPINPPVFGQPNSSAATLRRYEGFFVSLFEGFQNPLFRRAASQVSPSACEIVGMYSRPRIVVVLRTRNSATKKPPFEGLVPCLFFSRGRGVGLEIPYCLIKIAKVVYGKVENRFIHERIEMNIRADGDANTFEYFNFGGADIKFFAFLEKLAEL